MSEETTEATTPERETRPGRGGSVCKRMRRNAKRFVCAWHVRRHRWPKGFRTPPRKHGTPGPQGHMGRPPGSGSMPYNGYFLAGNAVGTVKVPR